MQTQLTSEQIKDIIIHNLSDIVKADPKIRRFVLKITKEKYADKEKTEDRIDRVLGELKRDREIQEKKWEEQKEERKKDREAQEKKWEEQKEERKKDREAQEKKWEKDRQADREAQEKKWAEQTLKWDEDRKEDREIQEKKWAEQTLKWDEDRKEDREIQEKKWAEQTLKWDEDRKEDREIQEKKWAGQNRKWDEDRKADREFLEKRWAEQELRWDDRFKKLEHSVADMGKRLDSAIGGLGARWGMRSESAFRDGLKAILEESFNVKVENYLEFDDSGTVFGKPDQVELDVIVYNGTLILCEIKSSMSNSDMYIFWRKVRFYEERHQRKATRRIVISPMVSPKAMTVAKDLDIEVYGYAGDVPIM